MRGGDEPRDERRGRDETMSRREWLADGAKAGLGAAALGFGVGAGCEGPGTPPSLEERPPGPDDDLGPLPTRLLGRTGERVTILGLGTACMGEGPQSTDECVRVFSEAIDRGVRYVDTARIYRNAETALGQVLRTRREDVFLVTKCMTDSREEAQKSFETSLRELQVESVDLLHLHSTGGRDIDQVLGAGGAWEYLLEMKRQGKTRFVGITGHHRPANFVRMLETGQVDVMMVAMNFVDRHVYGFEDKVRPVALEKGTGVMGMKTFGGIRGGFRNNRTRQPSQMDPVFLQNAVRYSLALPGLTGVVIGVHDELELRQNIRYVLNAAPLSEPEKKALEAHGARLAEEWGPRFGSVS